MPKPMRLEPPKGTVVSLDVECDSCTGTGLYSGMCEGPGVAVVCLRCRGTGRVELRVKTFERRRGRRDIKTVRRSAGSFIATGCGPVGREITYKQFKKGEMP